MDEIQKEIEQMTATETVSAFPSNAGGVGIRPMTFTQRFLRDLGLRSIPKGQRLLHYGFPVVSGKQLADRLGVTAFNAPYDHKEAVISASLAIYGHKRDECQILEVNVWVNIRRGMCTWTHKGEQFWEHVTDMDWPENNIKATVKLDPVDTYCREIIPDRCLEHIRIAQSNGLKLSKMRVAYPVVEEVKRPDPIVVYPVNGIDGPDGLYLEITMWE